MKTVTRGAGAKERGWDGVWLGLPREKVMCARSVCERTEKRRSKYIPKMVITSPFTHYDSLQMTYEVLEAPLRPFIFSPFKLYSEI